MLFTYSFRLRFRVDSPVGVLTDSEGLFGLLQVIKSPRKFYFFEEWAERRKTTCSCFFLGKTTLKSFSYGFPLSCSWYQNCIQTLMKQKIKIEREVQRKTISLKIHFSISADCYPFDKQNSHPAQI